MVRMNDLSTSDQQAYRKGPMLGKQGLDLLMPMHIWVGPTGHILRAGPTLKKLRAGDSFTGVRLTECFEFRRPRGLQTMAEILGENGSTVQVIFRTEPRISLKGVVIALPGKQGALINLSLGMSVSEVVQKYDLKSKDFAASDPTVDMLYLIEAQSVVLQESKSLNDRLQGARIEAEEKAYTDTLTGLKNRRALDHVLARVSRGDERRKFGLMNVDLDYFKSVNDTHGHAAGDFVLQKAAEIFMEETRQEDIVARTGGDEFVLLLMNCVDVEQLNRIAGRIIERLQHPIMFEGAECRISASIGTTISSYYKKLDPDKLCSDADSALYQSKDRGRACFTVFSPS